MRTSLVFLFSVLVSVAVQAALPPQFDTNKWDQLVATAVKDGERMDSDMGQFRTLARLSPQDPSVTHQADYFSPIGYENLDGEFSVYYISAVSEFWKLDEQGNWDIDQWIYKISADGNLIGLSHNRLVEDSDGRVLVYDSIRTGGVDDPLELQHWGEKLTEWTTTQGLSIPSLH